MATGKPLKYDPLRRYLAELPPEVETVTLSVAEIAAIVGAPLPATARTSRFWQNARQTWVISSQARAWQGAGWRVAGFDYRAEAVTFVRVDLTP
jgi:hypothetical protein